MLRRNRLWPRNSQENVRKKGAETVYPASQLFWVGKPVRAERLLQGGTAAEGLQNGGNGCEGRVSGTRRRLLEGVVVSKEE